MKFAHTFTVVLTTLVALTTALPAVAQETRHDMHANNTQASSATETAPKVSGEIRKVDAEAGKITIRHAEIPNLEMPPMTMVFRAASPDLLSKAKAGEQVLFTAEKINGALTVTTLEPEPAK